MSHQINIDDLLHFNEESIMANSFNKRLIINTGVNASGEIISFFVVSKRNEPVYRTTKFVEQSRHSFLNSAVEAYNKL